MHASLLVRVRGCSFRPPQCIAGLLFEVGLGLVLPTVVATVFGRVAYSTILGGDLRFNSS